ncbi:TadE/TadG family type IV pilus assembly protein [Pelotomaculum propionicicum]|uniref:TadE/TadG family type IV pilus assembly protein n=1 Tax=Pelotomaculum propionicicum TaxID=258475 RepID=UPI003B820724
MEFALVLPLLLILIFGAIEFGRIFHATHVITSAAREGARAAAVGNTDAQITTKVENALSSLLKADKVYLKSPDDYNLDDPGDGEVYFSIDPEYLSERTDESHEDVTVNVKGGLEIIVPIVGGLLPQNPIILKSYATMRLE